MVFQFFICFSLFLVKKSHQVTFLIAFLWYYSITTVFHGIFRRFMKFLPASCLSLEDYHILCLWESYHGLHRDTVDFLDDGLELRRNIGSILFVYLFHEDLQSMSIQIVLPLLLLSSLLWRPLRGPYPDSSKLFHLPLLFVWNSLALWYCRHCLDSVSCGKQAAKINTETQLRAVPTFHMNLAWDNWRDLFVQSNTLSSTSVIRFFCLVSSCSTYPAFATRQGPLNLLQDLVRCVSVKRWQKLRFGNHVTLKDLWKCSWVWSSKATKGEKKNPPIPAFSPSHLLNILNILILPYMCTMQTTHLMYSNVYSSNNVCFLPCSVLGRIGVHALHSSFAVMSSICCKPSQQSWSERCLLTLQQAPCISCFYQNYSILFTVIFRV